MWNKSSRPRHLELISQNGRATPEPSRLLSLIKQRALNGSKELLEQFFAAADDLFYDLSSRASSDAEQRLYFDAMREIRLKQQAFTERFVTRLEENLTNLARIPAGDVAALSPSEITQCASGDLSLVDGETLEVDLAKNSMAGRARELFKPELYELTVRLDQLVDKHITEDEQPLDPLRLAELFIDTCQTTLTIDIKARLIFLKLFEKHLLKHLGHVYADTNQILVEAGIVPQVRKHTVTAAQAGAAHAAPQTPATVSEAQDSSGSVIISTEALARLSIKPHTRWISFSGNPGPVMASSELAELLTYHQGECDAARSQHQPANVVGQTVSSLLLQHNPRQPQALIENDDRIINLVALFFDEILEDRNLPAAMQALLCRLQIPVLKVALKDPSFLTNPAHPTRCLINRMTEAGLSFDENKPLDKDPLYKKMSELVRRLNRLYTTDEAVFAQLGAALDAALDKEKRKAALVEQRTSQTEAGKSRIKQARSGAQAVLYHKLKDVDLPESIRDFLTTYWLQAMVIVHLKYGEGSSEWAVTEQTVTDLIWICNRHDDHRSQQRRHRLLPELLAQLQQGLMAAIDNPEIRLARVQRVEQTIRAIHCSDGNSESFGPLNEAQKEALGKGGGAPKSWQEMTAAERQQTRYEELSSEYYQQALQMTEGTWLAYYDDEQEKVLRCKLATKTDPDVYVFVNRFGFKVLEKSRKQVAYDLQFDKALLLDTRPLFDRLMQKVLDDLQAH